MMLQRNSLLRRFIVIGTPLLTGILLLFHPLPDEATAQAQLADGSMDAYTVLAPIVDQFLVVHVLFAPALVLLGLASILLLDGVHGMMAQISRVSAVIFVMTYVMYETIVGTVSALLVRGAVALTTADQEVIARAINRIFGDPLLGEGPSVLALVAWSSWIVTVILAAVTLRRSGQRLAPCILLGLSSVFCLHASPLGPLGMIFMTVAVVMMERRRAAQTKRVQGRAPIILSRKQGQPWQIKAPAL